MIFRWPWTMPPPVFALSLLTTGGPKASLSVGATGFGGVDNVYFTLLTLNTQQVHFDAAYAAKTEWKKLLVDSTFTLAVLTGMSVRTVSAKVVANLGWDKVKATHPVFAGDTLYAESTILQKRESKSRPGNGTVTWHTEARNQRDEVVVDFERTNLVVMRGGRG